MDSVSRFEIGIGHGLSSKKVQLAGKVVICNECARLPVEELDGVVARPVVDPLSSRAGVPALQSVDLSRPGKSGFALFLVRHGLNSEKG